MSGSLVPFPSSNKAFVLDSWPLMKWLKGREPTASRVDQWIEAARDGHLDLVLSTINLGEVYHTCWSLWGEQEADRIHSRLALLPILVLHPSEKDATVAVRLKARFRISYADAFTAGLSREIGAAVLSGDPDFLKLIHSQICAVEWLGA